MVSQAVIFVDKCDVDYRTTQVVTQLTRWNGLSPKMTNFSSGV